MIETTHIFITVKLYLIKYTRGNKYDYINYSTDYITMSKDLANQKLQELQCEIDEREPDSDYPDEKCYIEEIDLRSDQIADVQ